MPAQPSPSGRTVHLSTSGVDARIAPDEFGGFVLEIGGAVQSHVDLADPSRIRYEYLRRMAHVLDGVAPAGAPVRVLHLGAGALTLPRYLQATRPGSEQTVVDLDRELVSFVLAELPLPAGTDLVSVVADARLAAVDLAMDGERFDAVVLDIGTGEEGAEHLRGAVFYGELLELLTAGGVLLVNIGDDAGLRFLGAELGALEEAAAEAGVSLDGFRIEETEHSHAAAARAVELAACGNVQVLVKGSLHSDELLAAVVSKSGGLRTERRISHVYAMDVPAYRKPVIVTDAAINIAPTLEHKRDICQNAVDLMRLLGRDQPKVAVLAAVETVNATMPATLDAAALTVMAARGQITGALVDGPLAFDNAISPEAVATKGIVSQVAGEADILLVPDLEAGNMLAKQLIYFAGATAAGLVLGARVPIVLTSRADPLSARIASAALAKLVAVRKAEGKA